MSFGQLIDSLVAMVAIGGDRAVICMHRFWVPLRRLHLSVYRKVSWRQASSVHAFFAVSDRDPSKVH